VPEAADALGKIIDMFSQRQDLVHGDYSPKNLMTNGFSIRMIDHEVVTRGDAAFDLAFLTNHMLLKSVHLPDHMDEFHELTWATFDTYMDRSPVADGDFEARYVRYLGGVHLARAVGKSKAEYLTEDDRAVVAEAGTRILLDGVDTLEGAIQAVGDAHLRVRLKRTA
jgi:thiamine kinase-like enzyme